jgi:hypothetical protein
MARVDTTPVRTWARTILVEVGNELLERAKLMAADRAAR